MQPGQIPTLTFPANAQAASAAGARGACACHDKNAGIFNKEQPDLVEAGVSNYGELHFKNNIGIFNEEHPDLVEHGFSNFGELSYLRKEGIFDKEHADKVAAARSEGGKGGRGISKIYATLVLLDERSRGKSRSSVSA